MTSHQQNALQNIGCDVRFDDLTRHLYATDASIYQIHPAGVAFPQNAQEAGKIIREAADRGLSITPRGAGTSLVGNAIGDGLIVEFSRYNRQIGELNIDDRTVRVGAGVVLDQLNGFLHPHGFCFGPDVATSARATLGGMIANNSSGARCPVYGTTADHVISLELVMSDGQVQTIGSAEASLPNERARIEALIRLQAGAMSERWPPGLIKRWPGYGIERFLQQPDDLTKILGGSEGTLAAISSAVLRISPLPGQKGLGLLFFASINDAMQATVEILDLKPAAIEHIDRPLLDQTRGQRLFRSARDMMELDTKPCEALLIVEFYENVAEKLSLLESRRLGLRTKIVTDSAQMNLVWSVRKSGLSLLTGCVGPSKPVAFIEDAAVRPAQLPDYVTGLQSIMKRVGLEASYYGHAASGLLHVRPALDLHTEEDRKKFRQVADETAALVRQFKGSLSAEHGVGIARTEYMKDQLGDAIFGVMREIKNIFDPKNVFNPGKIFASEPDGHQERHHRIDNFLRENFDRPIELPFTPRLAFAFKDRSFIGNLEQCNGCGGCRKDAPMMCPTFLATGEEVMSTRGRANIIRQVLELRDNGHDPLNSAELEAALSNCLSCKGCTPECPSNVNLPLLKTELLYARHRRDGLPLRERFLSNADLLGRMGCAMPALANGIVGLKPMRILVEKILGLSAKRSLPHYATERFDHWFARHSSEGPASAGPGHAEACPSGKRGKVILWDDTFVRYHEPHVGIAAVKVLETLGFEVELVTNRRCCGRPAFSVGNLDLAAKLGQHNISQLAALPPSPGYGAASNLQPPILFLEPSCYSMFVEDYHELGISGANAIAKRCFLFEQFVDDLLEREPNAVRFNDRAMNVAIHAHCHAKAILSPAFMARLAERLPGRKATVLDTGCCGMAGAFGALAEKYELSVQVAAHLIDRINVQPRDSEIIASGTSCRHQITDLTTNRPRHMAELLADALV